MSVSAVVRSIKLRESSSRAGPEPWADFVSPHHGRASGDERTVIASGEHILIDLHQFNTTVRMSEHFFSGLALVKNEVNVVLKQNMSVPSIIPIVQGIEEGNGPRLNATNAR